MAEIAPRTFSETARRAEIVAEVVTAAQAFMRLWIQAAYGARPRLRAYIESTLEFRATHRAHVRGGPDLQHAPSNPKTTR